MCGCTRITNVGVKTLSAGCTTRLEYLDFSSTPVNHRGCVLHAMLRVRVNVHQLSLNYTRHLLSVFSLLTCASVCAESQVLGSWLSFDLESYS